VSTGPGVCPNCGAPLELDESGNCTWCHARIRAGVPAARYRGFPAGLDLVPGDVDDCGTSAPFIFLALSVLGPGLSTEPVVREYLRGNPGLVRDIRALSAAVSAAGVRVRDAGLLKDSFDENLAVYTPAEIWAFDLAFDVIAMLGALDDLPGKARAMVTEDLRSLDQTAHSHTWKKDLKKAGPGPEEFWELRAMTPRRQR
jgi:hypothetical protein